MFASYAGSGLGASGWLSTISSGSTRSGNLLNRPVALGGSASVLRFGPLYRVTSVSVRRTDPLGAGSVGNRPHWVLVRVLVVDDDPSVRDSLRRSLEFNGYEVSTADEGQQALNSLDELAPDAVILDVNMPGLDGLETCRRLRAAGHDLPVLMLTAREEVRDRVLGLDAGADDYLPKPFALEELLARLRALLRRTPSQPKDQSSSPEPPSDVLTFEGLTLDMGTREVARDGRAVRLTRTEFALLEALMHRPRQVMTRGQILDEVWGYDFPTTANSLEVYVGYLRRKTEADGEPRLIHTVRGVGYVLRETPP